jgi:hypothetical protein
MRRHYHVMIGLSGLYIPNDNAYFSSKRAALAYMTDEYRRFQDDDFCANADLPKDERRPKWNGSQRNECYSNGIESITLSECDDPYCDDKGE